jgi:hypothetical protein
LVGLSATAITEGIGSTRYFISDKVSETIAIRAELFSETMVRVLFLGIKFIAKSSSLKSVSLDQLLVVDIHQF